MLAAPGPDDRYLCLDREQIGVNLAEHFLRFLWNIHALIALVTDVFPYLYENVGAPVQLAVCICFRERGSSAYYAVYAIFPSGHKGLLL